MKQSKLIILLFLLFQINSCIIINGKINTSRRNIDSLVGVYHSTNKMSYNSSDPPSMMITLKDDKSCYLEFQANCTCPRIGHSGEWEIWGKHILLKNYPIKNPILVDSKETTDSFITIQTIGDAPICWVFSKGNCVDLFNNSGFFKIPKNDADSIILTNNLDRYKIYNKELKENNFTIQFFEIKSTMKFNYKLKVTKDSSLKGKINDFEYCFIKK